MKESGKEKVIYASRQTTPTWIPVVVVVGVILFGLIVVFFCTSAG